MVDKGEREMKEVNDKDKDRISVSHFKLRNKKSKVKRRRDISVGRIHGGGSEFFHC